MRTDRTGKERLPMRTPTKILLVVEGVLIVALLALGVLQRCGIMPVYGAIILYLPLAALFALLGWGVYALVRRIGNRTAKILVGGGLVLVLMLLLLLSFSYIAYLSFFATPQRYSTLAAPSGDRKLVVLRAFDTDEARTEERKAARLAADPDGDDEVAVEDWGYIYKAYPRVLGAFYRINADVEGEVYLGAEDLLSAQKATSEAASEAAPGDDTRADGSSHGTLMVEWLEDDTVAHFFVENPGPAEGGDCYVRF